MLQNSAVFRQIAASPPWELAFLSEAFRGRACETDASQARC